MNDQRETKLEADDVDLLRKSPFISKLENFWYHNKWKVIIIAFFAIVLIVGVAQVAGKTEPDATVVVAVPETITPLQSADISSALVSIMPSDANGAGKKAIDVLAYPIYSEE